MLNKYGTNRWFEFVSKSVCIWISYKPMLVYFIFSTCSYNDVIMLVWFAALNEAEIMKFPQNVDIHCPKLSSVYFFCLWVKCLFWFSESTIKKQSKKIIFGKSLTENLIKQIYKESEELFWSLIPLIGRLLKVRASLINHRLLPPTHIVIREGTWRHWWNKKLGYLQAHCNMASFLCRTGF